MVTAAGGHHIGQRTARDAAEGGAGDHGNLGRSARGAAGQRQPAALDQHAGLRPLDEGAEDDEQEDIGGDHPDGRAEDPLGCHVEAEKQVRRFHRAVPEDGKGIPAPEPVGQNHQQQDRDGKADAAPGKFHDNRDERHPEPHVHPGEGIKGIPFLEGRRLQNGVERGGYQREGNHRVNGPAPVGREEITPLPPEVEEDQPHQPDEHQVQRSQHEGLVGSDEGNVDVVEARADGNQDADERDPPPPAAPEGPTEQVAGAEPFVAARFTACGAKLRRARLCIR